MDIYFKHFLQRHNFTMNTSRSLAIFILLFMINAASVQGHLNKLMRPHILTAAATLASVSEGENPNHTLSSADANTSFPSLIPNSEKSENNQAINPTQESEDADFPKEDPENIESLFSSFDKPELQKPAFALNLATQHRLQALMQYHALNAQSGCLANILWTSTMLLKTVAQDDPVRPAIIKKYQEDREQYDSIQHSRDHALKIFNALNVEHQLALEKYQNYWLTKKKTSEIDAQIKAALNPTPTPANNKSWWRFW